MGLRFPVDTPEFEAIAAAYRVSVEVGFDKGCDEQRRLLGEYAAPHLAKPLKGRPLSHGPVVHDGTGEREPRRYKTWRNR